jgi:hypothetical protein
VVRSSPWPAPTPAEAREATRQILSRSEFQPEPKSLYQRALDTVYGWLADLVEAVVGSGRGSLLAWAIVMATLAAIVYLVVRGLQSGRRQRADREAVVVDLDGRRPAVEWEAEAASQEAAGNWREGLRCRYRALIAVLARRGVVEEIPGRTAGEYRTTVRQTLPAGAPAFNDATDLFERAWYGGRSTGPDESAAFRSLAEQVVGR